MRWVFPTLGHLPVVVDGNRVHVGRSRKCDYRLEGQEVSARHAVLELSGSAVQIRDHESTNGVYVNALRLLPSESRGLVDGDVVRLGENIGIVDRVPISEADLPPHIERREIQIQFEVETDRGARRTERQNLSLIVGPSTQPSISLVEKVAPTDSTVILIGETGTGKEYVAKALHAWSKRPGQYVGINCWDLKGDPGLARARLFGVESGAFAGAIPVKGAFRDADGGTLLLDEVMELPLEVQPMLLRTLQERLVQPIGGKRPVSVDVRVIVAAKRPLDKQVEAGAFSLDLYQRLCGLTVQLPPLRARKLDIPFIFMSALCSAECTAGPLAPIRASDVEPALVEQLCLHAWPGNLRELVTLAGNYRRLWDRTGQPGYRFRKDDLPLQFISGRPSPAEQDRDRRDAAQLVSLIETLRAMASKHSRRGEPMRRSELNFEQACEKAGVQRSLGYRQFKKWEVLAEKGLVSLPSSDFERVLYRWYTEGKKE